MVLGKHVKKLLLETEMLFYIYAERPILSVLQFMSSIKISKLEGWTDYLSQFDFVFFGFKTWIEEAIFFKYYNLHLARKFRTTRNRIIDNFLAQME